MERSIHHKDGNKQNNSKENQIILCKDCHNVIHNGLRKGARKTAAGEITKSRTRKYSGEEDTLIKLKELRNQWLKSKDKKAWWKKK